MRLNRDALPQRIGGQGWRGLRRVAMRSNRPTLLQYWLQRCNRRARTHQKLLAEGTPECVSSCDKVPKLDPATRSRGARIRRRDRSSASGRERHQRQDSIAIEGPLQCLQHFHCWDTAHFSQILIARNHGLRQEDFADAASFRRRRFLSEDSSQRISNTPPVALCPRQRRQNPAPQGRNAIAQGASPGSAPVLIMEP